MIPGPAPRPDPAALHARARACIEEPEPERKLEATLELAREIRGGALRPPVDPGETPPPAPIPSPGRPASLRLVPPTRVPRRRLGRAEGRAHLLHALAHIEFNAVDLAWDAVYRFRGLPERYYRDWAGVAAEEAAHFVLLRRRLREFGYDYGDLPAHDGLWRMAVATAGDPLLRMALVPRVLEARGLDVTPGMQRRLREAGDAASADLLTIILRDEIGHVDLGGRWFRYLCGVRGLEPRRAWIDLVRRHAPGIVRGPLQQGLRLRAGFTPAELEELNAHAKVAAPGAG